MVERHHYCQGVFFLSFKTFILTAGQFTSMPDDQTVCVGADVTLDWRFDHERDLYSAKWFKDGDPTPIMLMYPPQPANPGSGITNIHHIANGAINITGVSLQDGGQYTCSIYYNLGSDLDSIPADHANVTVLGK